MPTAFASRRPLDRQRHDGLRGQAAVAVIAAGLLFLGAGCVPGKPPVIIATPTPLPATGPFPLARVGPDFVDAQGKMVDLREYASCCFSEDGEPEVNWAQSTHEDLDRVKAKLGGPGKTIIVHWRIGPARVLPDFPAPQIALGAGPYADTCDSTLLKSNDTPCKADLANWNPRYWAYIDDLISYADSLGITVEMDVTDGWGCKKFGGASIWKFHPWEPGNNIQGIDAVATCGQKELAGNDPGVKVQTEWVRKLFMETAKHKNLMYQDGNEINLVGGYDPIFTASTGNHLRDVEAILRVPRHLFGSNAPSACALPQVDYCTIHTDEAPTVADRMGTNKPVVNNEYNPEPAFSPEALYSRFCQAKANGTYFAYWRHGQTLAQANATWGLMAQPCPGIVAPERMFPQGVPEEAFTIHTALPALMAETNEAIAAVSGCAAHAPACPHGKDPMAFLAAVTAELRKRGLWAGQHREGITDEIAVARDCKGNWDGDHITTFGNPATVVWVNMPPQPCSGQAENGTPPGGCPGLGPGAYRGSWSIRPEFCP